MKAFWADKSRYPVSIHAEKTYLDIRCLEFLSKLMSTKDDDETFIDLRVPRHAKYT